jgi:hypothetical protein
MVTKPTHTVTDFSFSINGWDFVMQVQIFDNKITDEYDVLDIDFEGKEIFDLQKLRWYIEENLQEELHAEIVKQTDSEEDARSEYRASIKI